MAPSATNGTSAQNGHENGLPVSINTLKEPMKSNGSLDSFEQIQLAPIIGTEFPSANLVDMMNAPNADELIAELAYTSTVPTAIMTKPVQRLTIWYNSLLTRRRLVPRTG